ncbi:MAG: hypothetical protein K2W78_11050 [Xanthobacteraceae bacterium]|nr:hypothetical protein [Xanthobacteraceae bacterium]
MRFHFRDNLDPVFFELLAVALLMALLGGAIYYYGSLYGLRTEVARVTRFPSGF